ncbi:uncharacterized protein LOC131230814 isoform X2 [Magnolia sinica]|uniref:uncharacterized protein LOC131230814 isoform X2 n=1 Tax=Magnolia sinica TaxID=86752 RepID=UPI00265B6D73|nr:uncharacterized protein LOC131230814 isoform X2 [Magnolia sinica]
MARVSSNKHDRDQALDFQDFLNDLQDWEHSVKEKDKKLKGHMQEEKIVASSSWKIGIAGEGKGLRKKAHTVEMKRSANEVDPKFALGSSREQQQFDYLRSSDAIGRISGSLTTEEGSPDAASEKELGNEYYKQKKFHKAIECYSRSIALSPSAVAFANRAMAYIKIKRFEEAENDCTEALNLDDRYIKAYSRRATARKELRKLKLSIEDSEFALRLEPNNQELRKLYTEVKELYDKEIVKKTSDAVKNSIQRFERVRDSETEAKGDSQGARVTVIQADQVEDKNGKDPGKPAIIMKGIESITMSSGNNSWEQQLDASEEGAAPNSGTKISNGVDGKHEFKASVQELASRAASQALAAAAKKITTPKSAYEFEVSWRALSDDHVLQAHLLKTIPPNTLPQIFKNALSAPILIDIIKCLTTFFLEEMELAVDILDNLTKVARFDMIIMCLSAVDKADLYKIWNEVFSNETVPAGHAETIRRLRPKYCLGDGWQMHVLESSGWSKMS